MLFELGDEIGERVLADQRSDGDETAFHAKLVFREIERLVELRARKSDTLEGALSDEERGRGVRDGDGHTANYYEGSRGQ